MGSTLTNIRIISRLLPTPFEEELTKL